MSPNRLAVINSLLDVSSSRLLLRLHRDLLILRLIRLIELGFTSTTLASLFLVLEIIG